MLAEQFLLHDFGLFERAAGERVLIEQNFPAHDLVDPFLADLQLPQRLGQFDRVAAGPEVSRRSLQHRDMPQLSAIAGIRVAAVAPEPITTTFLPSSHQIVRPALRVDDAALERFPSPSIPACSPPNAGNSPGTSTGNSR